MLFRSTGSAARHTCPSRVRFAPAPQVHYIAKWLHNDPDALAMLKQADDNVRKQAAIERALPQLWAEIDSDNDLPSEARPASPSEVRPTARSARTAEDIPPLRSARRQLSPPPTRFGSNGAPSSSGEPSVGEPTASGLGEQTRTAKIGRAHV